MVALLLYAYCHGERVMRRKHTLVTGYNAQLVVTDDQVIVGATVVQSSANAGLLPGVLEVCRSQLATATIDPTLRTVLADAGYGCEQTSPPVTRRSYGC